MILWEKSDCSPDWTELLSILADLAKLTEKCSKKKKKLWTATYLSYSNEHNRKKYFAIFIKLLECLQQITYIHLHAATGNIRRVLERGSDKLVFNRLIYKPVTIRGMHLILFIL